MTTPEEYISSIRYNSNTLSKTLNNDKNKVLKMVRVNY